jgi:ligand-binding sensor domain-containing protein/putative methionine-R-sulfoxide reductase with GAF domain
MRIEKHLKCVLATMLLLCFSGSISGQHPFKNFYFRHLKTEQGLANATVHNLMKDRDGFLWISTYNGLNCFDGSHCKNWKADPSQKNRLYCNNIYGMCEDAKGYIWCTTDYGISRYDKHTDEFENYLLMPHPSKDPAVGGIQSILYCRNGQLVTQCSTGVFIFDTLKNQFDYYPVNVTAGEPEYDISSSNAFLEDPYMEGIWIGTRRGLIYFDLEKKVFYNKANNPYNWPVFGGGKVYPVTLSPQKHIYFGDGIAQEIIGYDSKNAKIIEQISTKGWHPTDEIYLSSLLIDKNNNKWVSIWGHHIYFQDGKTGKISEIKNEIDNNYSIAANFFWDSFQDEDGTIYLGTADGVSFTNPDQNFFSIIHFPDSIEHEKQYALSILLNCDRQDNVWTTPSNQFLLKYNTVSEKFSRYDVIPANSKNKDSYIKIAAMEVTNDKLYFGTIDGIYVYDVAGDAFTLLKDIPDSENISGKYILEMLLTRNRDLWFTSHHNGLFRYNIDTRQYRHYIFNDKDSNSFSNNYIFDLHEDLEGNIWILSEFDGLMKYRPGKDNFEYLFRDKNSNLPKQVYTSMTHDAQNNLWLVNYVTGISRYNPRTKEIKIMTSENGLSNLTYHYPLTDNNNNLWLASFYEYSILNLKTLTADNFEIDYSKNSGQYMNHFCLMGGNRMVSETRNGFFIFNIGNRIPKSKMEPINISNLTAGDLHMPFVTGGSTIKLTYLQNFLSFDFSTISFLKNPNIRFAYMLEGVDKDWVQGGARQTAYYTNVSGGEYNFRVKAMDENGVWYESKEPVSIAISSVFYATVWFKFFLLALLFAFIYWYYRLWKKREIEKKSEQAIAYFANSVSGRTRVEEILWDITHNVIARSDFVDCVVYLLDEDTKMLVQKAAYGNKNPSAYQILNPIQIPLRHGIVGSVAASGRPEIVNNTSKDSRYIPDDESRLSEMAVPILYEGKVIGVIDSEHPKKNFFTQEHLELLTTIESITGTKIINAQKEIEISENAKRLDDLKVQIAETRQQALRAQMNPHFIFNCLNSINGFILQNDADIASTFLIKFSKLIRLILEHSNEKSISLDNELEALRLYIDMELLRFEKKFTFEIVVDDEVLSDSVMVPPLIFQPFIENSIWHGLLHKETAGTLLIHISQDGNMLECAIEDNGIGRQASEAYRPRTATKKKSLGLQLTKERLYIMNEQENRKSSVEVLDLVDPDGSAAGTRVVIRIECFMDE